MRRLRFVFQELIKTCFIFLLCFVWIRYFVRKVWLVSLLSALLTAIICILLAFVSRKKTQKNGLKLKEKEDAENMFFSLACASNPMDFFSKLASKKHDKITKHRAYITIDYKEVGAKTILYAEFSFDGLNISKFMEIYNKLKKEKATKIVLICKSVSDKRLESFCENFSEKFIILDEYAAYEKLYKVYDCYPEITQRYNTTKKMMFKDFVAYSFNKKRTKGYLFSSLVLILSGLFVRMTIYYCIIASLLIVFALISQFNPYFNTKKQCEVL